MRPPQGGPGKDTAILVYKVYYDGFKALDLGGSAAQSVVLMVIVIVADGRAVPLRREEGAATDARSMSRAPAHGRKPPAGHLPRRT